VLHTCDSSSSTRITTAASSQALRDNAPVVIPVKDLCVIDTDTHLTEPHDMWTSRAPAALRDRVPRVVDVNGHPTWVVDGVTINRAGANGVINAEGEKVRGTQFFLWTIDQVHPGAHSIPERVAMMDEQGIWAQVVYPNAFGLGSQQFLKVADEDLRLTTVQIFNDAMAEMHDLSGGRLYGMAALPFWDIDATTAEVERIAALGLRGVNLTSAPHEHGYPDLGTDHWEPLWERCAALGLPVNFHIGAADSDMAWFGSVSWPSLWMNQKLGLGSAMLYLNNAGVFGNLIYSGLLERHPDLRFVSVESGVGWIPFFLRALDYQIGEMSERSLKHLTMKPSEYFRRQVYSCFWFEKEGIDEAIEAMGHEHVLFETDFPHPTCSYPHGLDIAEAALAGQDDEVRQAVMGGNAATLYRIPTPG
jgi:predicted TIM-barrel fold metal-dependent hydrolase